MVESLKQSSSWLNFQKALSALERSVAAPILEPRDLSGIIKDFEMTYELSWKVLKKVLREQGHETLGAKDVYGKSYQLGFLSDEKIWVQMIEDRNQTSHVYEESEARRICDRIKTVYVPAFQVLKSKLVAI